MHIGIHGLTYRIKRLFCFLYLHSFLIRLACFLFHLTVIVSKEIYLSEQLAYCFFLRILCHTFHEGVLINLEPSNIVVSPSHVREHLIFDITKRVINVLLSNSDEYTIVILFRGWIEIGWIDPICRCVVRYSDTICIQKFIVICGTWWMGRGR